MLELLVAIDEQMDISNIHCPTDSNQITAIKLSKDIHPKHNIYHIVSNVRATSNV